MKKLLTTLLLFSVLTMGMCSAAAEEIPLFEETDFEFYEGCDHDWRYEITAPDCGHTGVTHFTCSLCGDEYDYNPTPRTGSHDYQNGVCTVCGLPDITKLPKLTMTAKERRNGARKPVMYRILPPQDGFLTVKSTNRIIAYDTDFEIIAEKPESEEELILPLDAQTGCVLEAYPTTLGAIKIDLHFDPVNEIADPPAWEPRSDGMLYFYSAYETLPEVTSVTACIESITYSGDYYQLYALSNLFMKSEDGSIWSVKPPALDPERDYALSFIINGRHTVRVLFTAENVGDLAYITWIFTLNGQWEIYPAWAADGSLKPNPTPEWEQRDDCKIYFLSDPTLFGEDDSFTLVIADPYADSVIYNAAMTREDGDLWSVDFNVQAFVFKPGELYVCWISSSDGKESDMLPLDQNALGDLIYVTGDYFGIDGVPPYFGVSWVNYSMPEVVGNQAIPLEYTVDYLDAHYGDSEMNSEEKVGQILDDLVLSKEKVIEEIQARDFDAQKEADLIALVNRCGSAALVKGDVDGDGKLTIADVTLLQRYLADFTGADGSPLLDESDPDTFCTADFNSDNTINIQDVTAMQRSIAEFLIYD